MTRPGYPPQFVPAGTIRPGDIVTDSHRHVHVVTAAKPCQDRAYVHLTYYDRQQVVCGCRYLMAVTR